MNARYIIVFDLETSGLIPGRSEMVELAGKAYDIRTFEPIPASAGGEFVSLLKPLHPEFAEAKALEINGRTLEELAKAPDQKVVWLQWLDWVKTFNPKGTSWTAPIAAGKNIRNFDLKFVEVMNNLHSPKKEKTVLFSPRHIIDLEDFILYWFDLAGSTELPNGKMDTLRDYFGISKENAHQAMKDVQDTGELIFRFLRLHRELRNRSGPNGKLIKFNRSVAP